MSSNDLKLQKKPMIISVIAFAILYSLKCFLISPLRQILASNIAFDGSVIPDLLGYLGSIAEIVAMSVCFAVILYVIYCFGDKGSRAGSALFLLFSLYKYAANMLVSWITEGSVPTSWIWDVVNVLFYTSLEAVQLGVVILIVRSIIGKQKARDNILKKAGKQIEVYPFGRLYDKENCLMRGALASAMVVFFAKLFGLLVSDIYTMAMYGLPSEAMTVVLMLVIYLANLLFGVICYATEIFTLSKLLDMRQKAA